jgi:aminoglycoside 6-adenylyltransferase
MNFAETETIQQLITWGNQQPLVRAMLLTSTRAVPGGTGDRLSDYDVILVLSDVLPFHEDRAWLEAFGRVLVMFRDPLQPYLGYQTSGNVVQFEGDLKIDFTLWPVEVLQQIVSDPNLIPELDAGYRVLLDKDYLTKDLQPPTYKAYIPTPPDMQEYQRIIEVFFLDAIYVGKYLWRDDLMAAKFVLECDLKQEHVRPMLEWHIETDHQWSIKPGPYGRGLKKWLRPDLWADLERTYSGPDLEENWQALYRVIDLMRKASLEVGQRLGFAYPHDIDRRAMDHLNKLKNLERGA